MGAFFLIKVQLLPSSAAWPLSTFVVALRLLLRLVVPLVVVLGAQPAGGNSKPIKLAPSKQSEMMSPVGFNLNSRDAN